MSLNIDRTIKKTKKPHNCFACLKIIPIGSSCGYFVSYQEDFSYGYCCESCADILDEFGPEIENDGVYYEGCVREWENSGDRR